MDWAESEACNAARACSVWDWLGQLFRPWPCVTKATGPLWLSGYQVIKLKVEGGEPQVSDFRGWQADHLSDPLHGLGRIHIVEAGF